MTVGKSLVEDMARAIWLAAKAESDAMGGSDIPEASFDDMQIHEQDFARRMAEACLSVLKDRLPADDRELVEALKHIQLGMKLAYEKGLHEFGYDPVAVVRDRIIAYSASRDENEGERP